MKQIEKNTVSKENQLKKKEYVSYINPNGKGKRIMFVGNSITRHAVAPQIGWLNDWGMAASSADRDYVHILASRLSEIYPDSAYCVCQASFWEKNYINGKSVFDEYKDARDFNADIIVMRIIENCSVVDFNADAFYNEYTELINYLNNNHAGIVLTSSFWEHPGDKVIEKIANEFDYPFAYLGELGENDDMKAVGLFEHGGVAAHPGDAGMKKIADIIFDLIMQLHE